MVIQANIFLTIARFKPTSSVFLGKCGKHLTTVADKLYLVISLGLMSSCNCTFNFSNINKLLRDLNRNDLIAAYKYI